MAFHDSSEDTIRHTKCDLLLSSDSGDRCQQCTTYRYIIQLLSSVHWINPSVWINPFFSFQGKLYLYFPDDLTPMLNQMLVVIATFVTSHNRRK